MTARGILLIASLALLTILLASCDGEDDEFSLDGTVISISDIAGNWTATRAHFSAAAGGPAMEVGVVALGGTVTLGIQNNGRFTLTVTRPGEGPDVTTGQLGFDEDLLVVIYDDDPDEFDFFGITSSATTLSIQGPGGYDFDGDGTEEAAFIELDFVRA